MQKQDSLEHVGILGMHWGHHKSGGESTGTKGPSADHVTVQTLKKKKLSDMSNAELKTLTSRLNLEKSYKELTVKKLTPSEQAAKDFVDSRRKELTKKILTAVASSAATLLIRYLKSRMDKNRAASDTVDGAWTVVKPAIKMLPG